MELVATFGRAYPCQRQWKTPCYNRGVMTKAQDFVTAVKSQRVQPESVEEYWKRQRSIWLADLFDLQGAIKVWMGPVVDANAVTIEDKLFSTTEPDLGTYDAPGLELALLTDPLQVVLVRPRGLRVVGVVESGGHRVVGASGRVDLECGVKREIVLRFRHDDSTTWYSFSSGNKRELNEDVYFELLARTADLPTLS